MDFLTQDIVVFQTKIWVVGLEQGLKDRSFPYRPCESINWPPPPILPPENLHNLLAFIPLLNPSSLNVVFIEI